MIRISNREEAILWLNQICLADGHLFVFEDWDDDRTGYVLGGGTISSPLNGNFADSAAKIVELFDVAIRNRLSQLKIERFYQFSLEDIDVRICSTDVSADQAILDYMLVSVSKPIYNKMGYLAMGLAAQDPNTALGRFARSPIFDRNVLGLVRQFSS